MHSQISLQIVQDKFKVMSPYNQEFIAKARRYHGRWKTDRWWFDDTALDMIREILVEMWNTTGEVPYENCCLLIQNHTKSAPRGPVYLFHRMIARSYGRTSKTILGTDIHYIGGKVRPGGNWVNWETRLIEATFEIRNFPLPATLLPDVQQAIAAGWCKVIRAEDETKRWSGYQTLEYTN